MGDQHSPPKAPADAVRRDPRWRVPVVCLVLAAITFAVFGQTLRHEFVNYDDDVYVYDNPIIERGLTLKGFVWAFARVHANNWHPLTWLSHMLDCQLYDLHPFGHHLTNVILHIATVIALFLVLRQMTGALWRSAFVAAVFSIHPLRVESVAWVSERKDLLAGLFFMLTIGAYVLYARRPWSLARYGLVFFLLAMGLMCKPMLVTLPVVLLLLDYWPLQRMEPTGKLLAEKLPFLALSVASCIATILAQAGVIQSAGSYSLPFRLANALATCVVYLVQMVYPAGLAVFYPYPYNGRPPWEIALAGMLLISLSAVALQWRRKEPWLLVGWCWYLVMLLPVVGIIQAGEQAHADRYTYLPQIGIYLAVTWQAAELRLNRVALGGLMTGVIVLLAIYAWKQTAYWKDSETLWTHTLASTTRNDMAHNNLGTFLLKKGRVDEAAIQFQAALQIKPNDADSHYNLGTALLQQGRVDDAIAQFQTALQLQPDDADAHYNLATAFRQEEKMDEAITHYRRALQIQPDNAGAHYNLALALRQEGKVDEAITHYEKALQIQPDNADAHNNLGNLLLQKGRIDEAIFHFQKALEINPGNAKVHNNLGNALLHRGRVDEAIAQIQQALQLDPANPAFLNNLEYINKVAKTKK